MASSLKISVNYLSLIENGHKEPSLEFVKRFARTFDIPASYLLLDVDEDSVPTVSEAQLVRQINRLMLELFSKRAQASGSKGRHGGRSS